MHEKLIKRFENAKVASNMTWPEISVQLGVSKTTLEDFRFSRREPEAPTVRAILSFCESVERQPPSDVMPLTAAEITTVREMLAWWNAHAPELAASGGLSKVGGVTKGRTGSLRGLPPTTSTDQGRESKVAP